MANMIKVTVSIGSNDISEFTLNRDKTPGHMRMLVALTMTATNTTSKEDHQAISEINVRACMSGQCIGYLSNDMALKVEYFSDNKL